MNMVILEGYLGNDPEIITLPSGKQLAVLNLATNEKIKKNGEVITRTDWHKINVWGKQAKVCSEHLKKGSRILVTGSLRNNDVVTKDGVRKKYSEIFAEKIKFISNID